MTTAEGPIRTSTLDDLIVDIVSNDGYNKYVTEKVLDGDIDHPIQDWHREMRQHSSEKYGLPLNSLFITDALAKCAERLERG